MKQYQGVYSVFIDEDEALEGEPVTRELVVQTVADAVYVDIDSESGAGGFISSVELDHATLREVVGNARAKIFDAMQDCRRAMQQLADTAGDVPEWNEGGYAYEAAHRLREALALAEAELPNPSGWNVI